MKRYETAVCALIVGSIHLSPSLAREVAAQNPCQPRQDLISVPEIRSQGGLLRAELKLTSGERTIWEVAGDTRCVPQDIRYITGRNLLVPQPEDPLFSSGVAIPGPTLRARVGDMIQIRFLNHVDTRNFPFSLDQANTDASNTTGCDEVRTEAGLLYPGQSGDLMPNCLHGSSTSNIHFHGTHTTPNTTGDNILLFVRPAPRDADGRITQDSALIDSAFQQIWETCSQAGSPTAWSQLPERWRADQERLIKQYDATAPYRGVPGNLPPELKLWPANEKQIAQGIWPQNQMGAYPYCFRLADPQTNTMGQAPGTHWYHAHKHGSTALNVANGLAGVLVVEGQYDDDLRRFYGAAFRDQVLMIQQISTTPFPLLNPAVAGKGPRNRPLYRLSVNGRLKPVVKMRPGEVQLWRVANGTYRDAVQLQRFDALPGGAAQGGVAWRQIALDGVQFAYGNYQREGAENVMINLAPGNRVDLLVKAPREAGRYALIVQPNEGLPLDPAVGDVFDSPIDTLLTVSIEGEAVNPAQDFIQDEAHFPAFPAYLADIPETDIGHRREVVFGAGHNLIDGKTFDPNVYSQVMKLNSVEEWKISNEANNKAHPFHIHVNPFQITELFQPNLANTSRPQDACYVNPLDPETWKPCTPLTGPYIWWDTFAIPTSAKIDLPSSVCTLKGRCPPAIEQYTSCTTEGKCTVTIPGYFKMRSRFVDFTGTYVVHCHILIHEDRGMMQLVQVVSDRPPYQHN